VATTGGAEQGGRRGLGRLRGALGRLRLPLTGLVGGLIGLGLAVAYFAVYPQGGRFDVADIEQIAQEQIASVTPEPPRGPQVYALLQPAVVQITRAGAPTSSGTPRSVGSGFVVDESGLILTSNHVVASTEVVTVQFFDGSTGLGRVTDREPERDLALIEVEGLPEGVVAAVLGGVARPGDEVFAIGSPFALEGSISRGIVSALGRSFFVEETGQQLTNMIQFDAAVNHGNSGGPLVDDQGRVVGVVTGLANPTGDEVFIGLGFAVPLDTSGGLLTPVD
jgi:S1-C subfamily serine protease